MQKLRVENIKKNFGDTQVLKDISFTLERGRVLTILGSSGSGKTTLLRCLNFLENPDSGTISIDGVPLLRRSEEEVRKNRLHFGLVFQNFQLFPQYSVLQNITLAPTLLKNDTPEAIQKQAMALLEQVGLQDKASAYPCQLSGGQQQRVAIARAMALTPDVLCFDEPTSALDPELTGEVLRVIRSLKEKNYTMIIVTHDMAFAKSISDVVIYMADGVIEETGTPEQVFGATKSQRAKAFLTAMQEPQA